MAGDAARLHQVLANLLANARTHTPPGTTVHHRAGAVDGRRRRADRDRRRAGHPRRAAAARSSSGSPAATRSRSRAAGSTGLGLAIVAAVVEAHGGAVEVASRPGETRFTVRLPATPAPSGG